LASNELDFEGLFVATGKETETRKINTDIKKGKIVPVHAMKAYWLEGGGGGEVHIYIYTHSEPWYEMVVSK
jgi:hypothetical protein